MTGMFNMRRDVLTSKLYLIPTDNTDKGKQFLSTKKSDKGE